jgi:hypothetical protein
MSVCHSLPSSTACTNRVPPSGGQCGVTPPPKHEPERAPQERDSKTVTIHNTNEAQAA